MTVITRRAAVDVAADGRTLEATVLPWNVVARVSDDGGRTHYDETWEPGSLVAADGVMGVYRGHTRILIGRAVPLESDGTGFRARLDLADTVDARDVHALATTVGAEVSIEAEVAQPVGWQPGQRVVRTRKQPGRLTGVAVVLLPDRGAYKGAVVTAARSQPGETMSDTPTPTPEPAPPVDPPTPPPAADQPVVRSEIDEAIRQAIARVRVPQLPEQAHPLARFRTFVDYADAAYTDPELGRVIARVWVDQITANNTAIVAPGWISEIFGIVDHSRPLIAAIGTRPLPPGGMSVEWPFFAGDLAALVQEQVTQKTEITSVRVDLSKGSADIKTYAGGSDISYQLIRRSSPSYRDAYLRIMNAAYALRTDFAASAALYAMATSAGAGWVAYNPATADPTTGILRAAVFAGSVAVENATGQPASVILASTDQFIRLGGLLTPASSPVQNVVGTGTASTLAINVSGLQVVHARYLPAGTMIMLNGQAAKWSEDGPMVISSPDVPKLGEDTAIWGMGALEVTSPAGVVLLAAADPVP